MKNNIVCFKCKRTSLATSNNVRSAIKETGFYPVLAVDTSMLWLCPECVRVILPLINALRNAVDKTVPVYWPSLMLLAKEVEKQVQPGIWENCVDDYEHMVKTSLDANLAIETACGKVLCVNLCENKKGKCSECQGLLNSLREKGL
jgi:hypothetical protein